MSLVNLDNLVKAGHLKIEVMNPSEFSGLLHSGQARLVDANNTTLALESRFDEQLLRDLLAAAQILLTHVSAFPIG